MQGPGVGGVIHRMSRASAAATRLRVAGERLIAAEAPFHQRWTPTGPAERPPPRGGPVERCLASTFRPSHPSDASRGATSPLQLSWHRRSRRAADLTGSRLIKVDVDGSVKSLSKVPRALGRPPACVCHRPHSAEWRWRHTRTSANSAAGSSSATLEASPSPLRDTCTGRA